jgi:hypothetical protein
VTIRKVIGVVDVVLECKARWLLRAEVRASRRAYLYVINMSQRGVNERFAVNLMGTIQPVIRWLLR